MMIAGRRARHPRRRDAHGPDNHKEESMKKVALGRKDDPYSQRYGLWMLFLLLAANTLSNADRHVFSVLIPAIKQEFGASDSLMGLIAGPCFFLSYVLFSLPLARIADRWSRTRIISISITLWSVAAAFCGLVGNVMQLAAARAVIGIGEAGGFPPSQSIVSELFDKRKRSAAMGILAAGTYLGLVLGLAGGAAIADRWGWRMAFLALALPGLPVALLIWLTGPRRRRVAPDPRETGAGGTLWSVLLSCWRIPSLRLAALAMGVFNIFGYAGAIWLPAYFMRSHGMTVLEAGTWLGMGAALGGVAGSMSAGKAVDMLAPRDIRWQLRMPGVALLLSFPLMVAMLAAPARAAVEFGPVQVPVVALLSIATGFLGACWAAPVYGSIALIVPPFRRGQAAAVLTIVVNLMGSVCGPLMAGFVSDLLVDASGLESIRYSLLMMSLLTVGGGFLFLRAARRLPQDILHDGVNRMAEPSGSGDAASGRGHGRVDLT
jgi:MFS family permease